jgi:hypothetical protein
MAGTGRNGRSTSGRTRARGGPQNKPSRKKSAPPRSPAPPPNDTPRDASAQWRLWPKRPLHAPRVDGAGGSASAAPAETPPKRKPRAKRLKTPSVPPLGVLAIHGVGPGTGRARAGFSAKLRRLVFPDEAAFGQLWHECVWEDLHDGLDDCISGIVSRMADGPLFDGFLQKSKLLARILGWIGGASGKDKIIRTLEGMTRAAATRVVSKALDIGLDFCLYLDSPHGQALRGRLRKRIASVAQKHPQGILLLGHSLGSVIAYDLLAEARLAGETLPVAALATIGSPLAWTFDIRRADNRPEAAFDSIGPVPWTNFYYREDYIALYSSLPPDRFPEARNVHLSLPKSSSPLDAHRAYWADPALARRIRGIATETTVKKDIP